MARNTNPAEMEIQRRLLYLNKSRTDAPFPYFSTFIDERSDRSIYFFLFLFAIVFKDYKAFFLSLVTRNCGDSTR